MRSGLDEAILSEIALQSQVSIDVVRQHYQTLLRDLHLHARIHDYLPLLAMKMVREHFHAVPPVATPAQASERQRILRCAREMEYALISYGH